MSNQRNKIQFLENEIVNLEETITFLKQIINSQNEIIKSLVSKDKAEPPIFKNVTKASAEIEYDEKSQELQEPEPVPEPSNTCIKIKKKEVLDPSSLFRRRTML